MQYKVIIKRGKFKKCTLKVTPFGEVKLTVPNFLTENDIYDILNKRQPWIHNAIEKMVEANGSNYEIPEGKLLYLGEFYKFEKSHSMSKYYDIDDKNLSIKSGIDLTSNTNKLKFYKDRANFILPARITNISKNQNLPFEKINIRDTRSRWGSCSSSKAITLSMRLIMAPYFVIDAIIFHELVHTKFMNHSSNFYAFLYEVYPNYHSAEKWLKENYVKIMFKD